MKVAGDDRLHAEERTAYFLVGALLAALAGAAACALPCLWCLRWCFLCMAGLASLLALAEGVAPVLDWTGAAATEVPATAVRARASRLLRSRVMAESSG